MQPLLNGNINCACRRTYLFFHYTNIMSNVVKVWDETLPLFSNTEVLNRNGTRRDRDWRHREFLQGEYLSEAESTKNLWFEIKFQIYKHCTPSCHIKTATIDFKQVKFLNVIWDGRQKDWNDLNSSQSQISRTNKTGIQKLSNIPNYDKSFCELGKSWWSLFFKVGGEEKKKNRKNPKQINQPKISKPHHFLLLEMFRKVLQVLQCTESHRPFPQSSAWRKEEEMKHTHRRTHLWKRHIKLSLPGKQLARDFFNSYLKIRLLQKTLS